MSLQLVSMLIYAPKEVGSTMHIQHNSFPILPSRLSFRMIPPHLNPFSLQCAAFPPPLPPILPSHFVDAMVAQLGDERIRSL